MEHFCSKSEDGDHNTTTVYEPTKLEVKIWKIEFELGKLRDQRRAALKKKVKDKIREAGENIFVDSSDEEEGKGQIESLNFDELDDRVKKMEKKLRFYRAQNMNRLKKMVLEARRRAGDDDVESDDNESVIGDEEISTCDESDGYEGEQELDATEENNDSVSPDSIYNIEDEEEEDPLEGGPQLMAMARKGQDKDVLRILKKDPNLILYKDKAGNTVLHLAVKMGHKGLASYLIQERPEMAYDINEEGISPLYLCVKDGYRDLVIQLFQIMPGSSVLGHKRDHLLLRAGNFAVVHAAIKAINLEMVHTLLDNMPILIESTNEKGWKPLSYAAFKVRVFIANYLINKFPDSIRKRDEDGSFPIHKAVVGGNVGLVKELQSSNPQTIFDVDENGQSVLHYAVKFSTSDVLSYLNRHRDIKKIKALRDNDGNTAFQLAKKIRKP